MSLLLSQAFFSACDDNSAQLAQEQDPTADPSAFLAASEFAVGDNRFPFVLVTQDGVRLSDPQVGVEFWLLQQDAPDILKQHAQATYREIHNVHSHSNQTGQTHNDEVRSGFYAVDNAIFDVPGIWQAHIFPPNSPDRHTATVAFYVLPKATTIQIGDHIVPSRHPTQRDVKHLSEITTHQPAHPKLYEFSIADALTKRKPIVIAFSSPAFCMSDICSPVTDLIAHLSKQASGSAIFIHIEPWDIPTALTEGRLVPSSTAKEWNLPTEPWVFVSDKQGLLRARFEGPVTEEDILSALQQVSN